MTHSTIEQQAVQQTQSASAPAFGWHGVTQRLGLADLFQRFADGAAERDAQHRLIHPEATALKAIRFGAVRLARTQGGAGIALPELFFLIRDLASADPNIAHIFRNHFFAVEQQLSAPSTSFARRLLPLVGEGKTLGVVFNEQTGEPAGSVGLPPGSRLEWSPARQGWLVSGTKIYSTGNLYADYLLATAIDPSDGQTRQFFVSASADGIFLDDDWQGFGQKLTGSGTTVFKQVLVHKHDLYDVPQRSTASTPNGERVLFSYTFHQVYLTTIITGIVNRVLQDALALVRQRQRNFYHGLSPLPSQEPEIQATIGRIASWRSALVAVTDRAIYALDRSWHEQTSSQQAYALSEAATLAASEAKVVVDETAANLASLLIDVASGSAVSVQAALDRHWRNIKVIAAHNPRTYKERVLGDRYLNGTELPTGAFF